MAGQSESDRGGATLAEVAEVFNLSRERIRQIERRALQKLRIALEERGYDAQVIHEHLADITGSGDLPDEN